MAPTSSDQPLACIDARVGRKPTGIGKYVLRVVEQFAKLDPRAVVPIVRANRYLWWRQLGIRPFVTSSAGDTLRRFPDAKVIHGPDFHALAHPTAIRIATVHDLGYLRLPECHPPGMSERLDALVRAAIPSTQLFICDSASTRDDFVTFYDFPRDRCRVVPLGVDQHYFEPAGGALPRELRGRQGEYLLHVGAMVPRKDLPTLLAAFDEISAEYPRLLLVLAGNKTLRWASSWPELERMMDSRPSLRSRVVVLNYVDDRALPGLYQEAAAAVSSTLWEGFGLTVLEALASGVPVVSSRISSIPEIAGDAVYYGEVRDPSSYADAIRRALTGHDSSGAAYGRKIAARFSWERTARETLAVYREAAGQPPVSAVGRTVPGG